MTPQIEALLREREHYVRRNLPERADAVTDVLASLGHIDPPEAAVLEPPAETTTPSRPKPRKPRSSKNE